MAFLDYTVFFNRGFFTHRVLPKITRITLSDNTSKRLPHQSRLVVHLQQRLEQRRHRPIRKRRLQRSNIYHGLNDIL
jgi:hypothetical protein